MHPTTKGLNPFCVWHAFTIVKHTTVWLNFPEGFFSKIDRRRYELMISFVSVRARPKNFFLPHDGRRNSVIFEYDTTETMGTLEVYGWYTHTSMTSRGASHHTGYYYYYNYLKEHNRKLTSGFPWSTLDHPRPSLPLLTPRFLPRPCNNIVPVMVGAYITLHIYKLEDVGHRFTRLSCLVRKH